MKTLVSREMKRNARNVKNEKQFKCALVQWLLTRDLLLVYQRFALVQNSSININKNKNESPEEEEEEKTEKLNFANVRERILFLLLRPINKCAGFIYECILKS